VGVYRFKADFCHVFQQSNNKPLNIEIKEEPNDIDSLTPEQMKEMLKKIMGKQ